MSSVAVLIPWRDAGCEHRSRALAYVLGRLAEHPWPVVIGRHDDGPWCKALAVADALSQTSADTLIVHDADVWTEGLAPAVKAVQGGESVWAVPHKLVKRLGAEATTNLLVGREPRDLEQAAYTGIAGGGITALRRDVYEDCPLDPRFEGWGQEDHSWGWALRTLHRREWRGTADLLHCWHPPQARMTRRVGRPEGRVLERRYVAARRDPGVMRRLVEEARCPSTC